MAEYIDRDLAIAVLKFYDGDSDGISQAIRSLKVISAADVRPVMRGTWENIRDGIIPSGICSNCRTWERTTDFCPYCGADMRKDGKVHWKEESL